MGERLLLLTDPARLRAATALLLLCPQIPLLFMGEETGSRSPFLFFTDFHDELADAVREGRRREFAKFPAFADPEQRRRIPDPNAAATSDASRPAPGEDVEDWRGFYRTLLALRQKRIVRGLGGARSLGAEAVGEQAVVARWRLGDGAVLTLALNLASGPAAMVRPDAEPLFVSGSLVEGGLGPASFAAWL
jgi:maltooligosyltrehalose trehalohydrolase